MSLETKPEHILYSMFNDLLCDGESRCTRTSGIALALIWELRIMPSHQTSTIQAFSVGSAHRRPAVNEKGGALLNYKLLDSPNS
jgi:hypothetical protein